MASLELFFQLGYEATSVNAIIATLGISKGSFYHHFPGKEAVLNAALESQLELVAARINQALTNPATTGVELLNLVLASSWQEPSPNEIAMAETVIALLKPENATILDKLISIERRVAVHIMTKIIERGKADGSFNVDAPAAAASTLYSTMVSVHFDTFRELLNRQIDTRESKQRLRFLFLSIERILGAPTDSLVGGLAEMLAFFDTLERIADLATAQEKPDRDKTTVVDKTAVIIGA